MQPSPQANLSSSQQALIMERTMLEVRRHWFGASTVQRSGAVSVMEPGSEMLMFVDQDSAGAERLIEQAAQRQAYVITTDFSRPVDLGARLRAHGYRAVQRNGIYRYTGAAQARGKSCHGLLSLLRRRDPLPVTVEMISYDELAAWNQVCWWTFGPSGTLEASLAEMKRAFLNMGRGGAWYLAYAANRPVGTACLYQGTNAAQVLAVGTLPAYRGRGVATTVMERVIGDWAENGLGPLFLDTKPASAAARLYLRLGFDLAYVRELYAPARPQ